MKLILTKSIKKEGERIDWREGGGAGGRKRGEVYFTNLKCIKIDSCPNWFG